MEDRTIEGSSESSLQPGRGWLLAFALSFMFFVFLSVTDHYDGIMTIIGAPIVSIVLTSVCMAGVALVSVVLRVAVIRRWWCSSPHLALWTMIMSAILLSCGTSIGIAERYVDSIDGSVRFRLHWALGVPCYILLLASVTFWPIAPRSPPLLASSHDEAPPTHEGEQGAGCNGS